MLFACLWPFIDLRFNLASSLGASSLTLRGVAHLTPKEMVSPAGVCMYRSGCARGEQKPGCLAVTQVILS